MLVQSLDQYIFVLIKLTKSKELTMSSYMTRIIKITLYIHVYIHVYQSMLIFKIVFTY